VKGFCEEALAVEEHTAREPRAVREARRGRRRSETPPQGERPRTRVRGRRGDASEGERVRLRLGGQLSSAPSSLLSLPPSLPPSADDGEGGSSGGARRPPPSCTVLRFRTNRVPPAARSCWVPTPHIHVTPRAVHSCVLDRCLCGSGLRQSRLCPRRVGLSLLSRCVPHAPPPPGLTPCRASPADGPAGGWRSAP
jgi:hypothetical protein